MVTITIKPEKRNEGELYRGLWHAWADGEPIPGLHRVPYTAAARFLVAGGLDTEEQAVCRHLDSAIVSFVTTLGALAAVTVKESPSDGPRFVRFKPREEPSHL